MQTCTHGPRQAYEVSVSQQTKSWRVRKTFRQTGSFSVCLRLLWKAQMSLFVQGLCVSVCVCVWKRTRVNCLQFLGSEADASVWDILEMCPWPPISTALFAQCNAAPIIIKPLPATTCHELLWATATPLFPHLKHQDPRSSLLNGCHRAFNYTTGTVKWADQYSYLLKIKSHNLLFFVCHCTSRESQISSPLCVT